MSQAESEQVIEHVKKLLAHAEELKKAVEELYEKTKSSELTASLEKLSMIKTTLGNFIARDAGEFSISLIDKCASSNCEDIGVVIKRPGFAQVVEVKRDASLVEIYQMFFDNKKILEKIINDLVIAIINVARAVEKEADLLDKIRETQRDIESISEELQEIKERIEDP